MTVTLTYDGQLSRVRVDASGLSTSATSALVERSTDQTRWTTIRGGEAAAVSGGVMGTVDDYEFTPDVPNYYRVTDNVAGSTPQTASITPTIGGAGVWLKSMSRPYLNQQVVVVDFADVSRSARTTTFDIIGRTYPVAVSDVRASRKYDVQVLTKTAAAERDLDLLTASGDPVMVQAPADSMVPGGYFTIGDTTVRRVGRLSIERVFTLPLTEVAAPGPDVIGAAITWQGIVNKYLTWQAVINGNATWADVLEQLGDAQDVIVP